MNTKFLLGAALVAVLNCTTLNAQVLGGNVVGHAAGNLGGSLGGGLGGLRNVGVMGESNGRGAFGADLDTGSLRRTSDDLTHRAKDRTRDTLESTRDRTHSTFNGARDTTERAVGTTAATARSSVDMGASTAFSAAHGAEATSRRIDATTKGAASAASDVEIDDAMSKRTATEASDQQAPRAAIAGEVGETVDASTNDGRLPLTASGTAAAQGSASATRDEGVSAQGSADGSAIASAKTGPL